MKARRAKLFCLIEGKIPDILWLGKGQRAKKRKKKEKTRQCEALVWPEGWQCRSVTRLLSNLFCGPPAMSFYHPNIVLDWTIALIDMCFLLESRFINQHSPGTFLEAFAWKELGTWWFLQVNSCAENWSLLYVWKTSHLFENLILNPDRILHPLDLK